MRLSALAGDTFSPDPEILGITADSRAVEAGFLFAALPGEKVDGARFIPQAEKNGAAAVLARPDVATRLPLIADNNPRARLSHLAARFYPGQPEIIAGVTGTNGKTSTAFFAAALWEMLGYKAGSIGTLGARAGDTTFASSLTTPEPVRLHEILHEMAQRGTARLVMEVSSHAIVQSRADGVDFRIGAFTNITQDHLDYHDSFDDYFAAKARLFRDLVKDDGIAVINVDGAGATEMIAAAQVRGLRIITTGQAGRDLVLQSMTPTPTGLSLRVAAAEETVDISLPLIGGFQAENALLAAGIVMASGIAARRVLPLLSSLQGVPGRMELAATINGAGIYVDYAHTPDAITTALRAARPHTRGKLFAIIGAGGDRDKSKRALMGQAAANSADCVIVTDDNPRSEDPAAIRQAVLEGCPGAIETKSREDAIHQGVAMLRDGDVLVIAGKGHETGQQVGDRVLPFNDVEVAQAAAAADQNGGR